MLLCTRQKEKNDILDLFIIPGSAFRRGALQYMKYITNKSQYSVNYVLILKFVDGAETTEQSNINIDRTMDFAEH